VEVVMAVLSRTVSIVLVSLRAQKVIPLYALPS
jgi:hypothetical protein